MWYWFCVWVDNGKKIVIEFIKMVFNLCSSEIFDKVVSNNLEGR